MRDCTLYDSTFVTFVPELSNFLCRKQIFHGGYGNRFYANLCFSDAAWNSADHSILHDRDLLL